MPVVARIGTDVVEKPEAAVESVAAVDIDAVSALEAAEVGADARGAW